MTFKLIDKQDRKKLSEGRSYGLGSAFCKRDGNTLMTIMPITACKDFASDVVYSQITGKPYQAHGLSTKKQDIYDGHAYMVLSVLKPNYGDTYAGYNSDVKALAANAGNIEEFMNYFEGALKLKDKTKITKIEDNVYACVFPLFWVGGTYLISLYSLLLRVGMYYSDADVKKVDPMTFLKEFKTGNDVYMVKAAIPKLEMMIRGIRPKQDFKAEKSWHNEGIVAFVFPAEKATV